MKELLNMRDCLTSLEEAYLDLAEGNLVNRPRIDISATTDAPDHIFRWGTMEAVNARKGYHAIRLKSDIIYWSKHDSGITEEKYCIAPGTFCGLILLFSARNGEPLAIINDGYLTHMRVGAIAALGAKYLSKEGSSTLGMLGSGWMARSHSSAFACVRDLKRIKIYSPTKSHRDQAAREIEAELGIEVTPVTRPQDAVAGSDIVAACTDSITPVLQGSWIDKGAHLTCVKAKGEWSDDVFPRIDVAAGGDEPRKPIFGTPFKRGEGNFLTYAAGDPAVLQQIPRWPEGTKEKNGGPRLVALNAMIAGKANGRNRADEISASGGSSGTQGLPFVTLGAKVYELAKQRGMGKEVPTELFLQNIRD
ncbi:MAG: hypothetical protein WD073_07710 [Xanthobacteraceae bacterium]